MKVGDYVRFDYHRITVPIMIAKITEEHSGNEDEGIFYVTDTNLVIDESNLVKPPSPNIIDLIEVGDIITFKDDEDVYKVIGRPDKECALEVFYLAKKYDGNTEDIMVYPDEMKKYIKSIVTREQFENMEYKVGGKER